MAHHPTARGYDMHTHSLFSDGTDTPSEIARQASELGLAGFALTDHDTINGWGEAREAAARYGIDFVPGVEVTTKHNGRSCHLLAYGVDLRRGELYSALGRVRDSRLTRAKEMVRRVSADYAITWDQVVAGNDDRTVGRPHIADALVAGGYFVDRSTAFAEILHPRSPYYIGTYAIDTIEAIELVRAAGGASVLAHPAASRQRLSTSATELQQFAAAGLWGVELEHPENRPEWLPELAAAVRIAGLETTGSSDFHGLGKPNRLGECTTPAEVVDRLRSVIAVQR